MNKIGKTTDVQASDTRIHRRNKSNESENLDKKDGLQEESVDELNDRIDEENKKEKDNKDNSIKDDNLFKDLPEVNDDVWDREN